MSVYKQAFIVHLRTVGGAQLQGMMETSTHHWVNTLYVTYLKCISLFIGRGVSLATFKMYNFIIIWETNLASFGLVFEGDWAGNLILTWQHWFALLGEVAVMVISLAGIICDSENKMLILTMYLKKYLNSNTNILQKYLNTIKYKCI